MLISVGNIGVVGASARAKGGASPYSAEAQAVFDRFTSQPDSTRKGHIDMLCRALVSAGVWPKLDALYLMAAHDSQAARQNWIADLFNLTAVSSPTFTTDRGYTGDGSAATLNTAFNPVTAAGKFAQNSAHMGVIERTNVLTLTAAVGNNGAVIVPRSNTDTLTHRINAASSGQAAGITDSRGHSVSSRTASNLTTPYKNAAALTTSAEVSVALASENIHFLSRAGTSLFRNSQVSAGHLGQGLTGAEVTALYNALNIYMTAIGA